MGHARTVYCIYLKLAHHVHGVSNVFDTSKGLRESVRAVEMSRYPYEFDSAMGHGFTNVGVSASKMAGV